MTSVKKDAALPKQQDNQEETTVNTTVSVPVVNEELELVKAELANLRNIQKDMIERAKVLHTPVEFNPLRNIIITIKPVQKLANTVIKDASEATMLKGSKRSYGAQCNPQGRLINPLTSEEQQFFTKLLGFDLSVDAPIERNFWTTKQSRISVYKTAKELSSADINLDLSNPYDYILYKVALAHNRIANSIKDLDVNPLYELVIVDEQEVLQHELNKLDVEDEVNNYLYVNKNNKKTLLDLLRLYGANGPSKHVNFDTSVEKLYVTAKELVKEKRGLEKIYNLIKLDKTKVATSVLIQDAISFGFILVNGNEYTLQGGKQLGYSVEAVEVYLSKPENRTIKMSLEQNVNETLKTKL